MCRYLTLRAADEGSPFDELGVRPGYTAISYIALVQVCHNVINIKCPHSVLKEFVNDI